VFTKDDIGTSIDVVIVDPTQMDLLPQFYTTQGFVALDATQTKERSYYNRHPIDQFLPLEIEIFGCLHKHVDVFLHDYANAIWNLKRTKDIHLSTLVTFLHQIVSVGHITEDANIFHLKLGNSHRLSYFPSSTPLQDTPPITTTDLLQAVDF
jgi:hypothetical protein